LTVDAKELVGRGVTAWGVGAHAKALGNGLEALGLLADGAAGAPPPGLVDEGSVGGVHEPDDAVIDVAGQVGGEEGGAVAGAEFGEFRHRSTIGGFRSAAGAGGGDEDPG